MMKASVDSGRLCFLGVRRSKTWRNVTHKRLSVSPLFVLLGLLEYIFEKGYATNCISTLITYICIVKTAIHHVVSCDPE